MKKKILVFLDSWTNLKTNSGSTTTKIQPGQSDVSRDDGSRKEKDGTKEKEKEQKDDRDLGEKAKEKGVLTPLTVKPGTTVGKKEAPTGAKAKRERKARKAFPEMEKDQKVHHLAKKARKVKMVKDKLMKHPTSLRPRHQRRNNNLNLNGVRPTGGVGRQKDGQIHPGGHRMVHGMKDTMPSLSLVWNPLYHHQHSLLRTNGRNLNIPERHYVRQNPCRLSA